MASVSREPFRVSVNNTFPNAVGPVVVETDLALANLGARAVAIGSTFEFFRLAKLHVYQYTTNVGPVFDADSAGGTGTQGHISADHALAFVESNAALTGTATTYAQMTQYELFKAGNVYEKLSLQVPKSVLQANPLKWYNTASTGASTDSLSPGLVISLVNNGLSIVSGWEALARVIIEGVIEFQGRITPALTFAVEVNGGPSKPPALRPALRAPPDPSSSVGFNSPIVPAGYILVRQ